MKLHDTALGLGFAAAGLALAAYSFTLPVPRHLAYGPGVFPRLMGIGMFAAGLAIALLALRGARGTPWVQLPDWARNRRLARNVLLVPGACLAYFLFSPLLGFSLSACVLLFVLFLAQGNRAVPSAVVALAVAAAATVLFASVLHVPLPWGPLAPVSGWLIW